VCWLSTYCLYALLQLRALNINLSANQVKEMIQVMDANQDGSLDWNEFQSIFGDDTNVIAKVNNELGRYP
jgi:Ca2+-binding EF-hand superfamily protein